MSCKRFRLLPKSTTSDDLERLYCTLLHKWCVSELTMEIWKKRYWLDKQTHTVSSKTVVQGVYFQAVWNCYHVTNADVWLWTGSPHSCCCSSKQDRSVSLGMWRLTWTVPSPTYVDPWAPQRLATTGSRPSAAQPWTTRPRSQDDEGSSWKWLHSSWGHARVDNGDEIFGN